MKFLLLAFYTFAILWLLPRLRFLKKSGLSARELRALFLVKFAACLTYGWVGIIYMRRGVLMDTWFFQYESTQETDLLYRMPGKFFSTIVNSSYPHGYRGFLSSRESWWNDLHSTLFIKLLALMNPLTGGTYLAKTPFFALIALLASVALYRLFAPRYPGKKLAILLGTFLVPSYLFWTAGIYRDAPVALALGISLLAFDRMLKNGPHPRYLAALFAGLITILVFRNVLLVLLLPALAAWMAAHRFRPAARTYAVVYGIYGILFFGMRYLVPALDFPRIAVSKQEDFFNLPGTSLINAPHLAPTLGSYLANTPHAIGTLLLRPMPWESYNSFIMLASAEVCALLLLLVYWVFNHRPLGKMTPFTGFCLSFSLLVFLIIGLTVTYFGALVRYRGIVLPLLVTPLLCTMTFPTSAQNILNKFTYLYTSLFASRKTKEIQEIS